MSSKPRALRKTQGARQLAAGLALLCATSLSGCVRVEGGAVEGRWELRKGPRTYPLEQGSLISCQDARIPWLYFLLQPLGGGADPCGTGESCVFACEPLVGTTPFAIPQGSYAMSLRGLETSGQLLGQKEGFIAPLPIVREVREGEVTDLSVNLIIVER